MNANRKRFRNLCPLAAITAFAAVAVAPQGTLGQSPGDTRHGVPTTPAYQYFTGAHQQNRAAAAPTRNAAPKQESMQIAAKKPFQDIQHPPALSPYLTLDYIESGTGVPNYYAFTRPMLQQNQLNEMQAREMRKQRQQVRTGGTGLRTAGRGMPTTGGSNQFQNLGSFYPGLR